MAKLTEAELADWFASMLNGDTRVGLEGWEIIGLDIGEIEATAPDGTKYRLTVAIEED